MKKKSKESKRLEAPSIEQLEAELGREKYRWRFRRVMEFPLIWSTGTHSVATSTAAAATVIRA